MPKELFEPDSIAIIGAAREELKVGHIVVKNLLESRYEGKIFPVNPKSEEILGLKCYPSVLDIPDEVQAAVICVPNTFVPKVMEECGEKKVKAAIIITAGFKEIGKEGAELEHQVGAIAKRYGIRVLGPNCLGIINTQKKMNATFTKNYPKEGSIGISSQSGAICSTLLDWASEINVGFSKFISVGNKVDMEEADILRYLRDDPATKVIGMYVEGMAHGTQFMEEAEATSRHKPVIALKAGRTSSGAKAASSHTGAISSSDRVYDAAMGQTGIIRVHNIEELFDLLLVFSNMPLPSQGGGVAIITNAGGLGVMAADACGDYGLRMASFTNETVRKLRSYLPEEANFYNPVDVIGDAKADRYEFAMQTVMDDPGVAAVLVLLAPTDLVDISGVASMVASYAGRATMPIVSCFAGGEDAQEGIKILRHAGIPNYPSPDRGVRAIGAMMEYEATRERNLAEIFSHVRGDKLRVERALKKARSEGRVSLSEAEGKEILKAYGVPVPREALADTEDKAVAAANKIGYPVVMKVESPDIAHKTDVGGVVVDLKSDEEVRKQFNLMLSRVRERAPRARVDGVSIQQMKSGREVIVGMVRDDQFGPVITFGLGGIFVEVLKDVSQRIVPLSDVDVWEMISSIKAYPILTGARGKKPADIPALREVIVRVAQIAVDNPSITELEINPVIVGDLEQGVSAVDALVVIRREGA
ncbi:MAG TPA: acetate--CoA ligase family protein [Methanomassiliicoccales archaeon]|nr:acetate--CoA ligase family protein [Methanomassiliicoccales archaeon]